MISTTYYRVVSLMCRKAPNLADLVRFSVDAKSKASMSDLPCPAKPRRGVVISKRAKRAKLFPESRIALLPMGGGTHAVDDFEGRASASFFTALLFLMPWGRGAGARLTPYLPSGEYA